ncbi:MAG TPA: hypothetical protein VGR84_18695 [Candidatus Acidoferrales bacterium]|nr:hypothetical protein [Candidatus Acidoferrales bacterium]
MAAAENPEEAAAEAREKVRLQVAASRKTKAERQEATSKVESETRKKAQKAAVAVVEKGQYPDDWKKHAQNVVAAGAAARRELEFFATLRGGEQQIFLALVVETAKATLHKAIAKVANSKPKAPKLTNADIPVAHIPRPEIATVN